MDVDAQTPVKTITVAIQLVRAAPLEKSVFRASPARCATPCEHSGWSVISKLGLRRSPSLFDYSYPVLACKTRKIHWLSQLATHDCFSATSRRVAGLYCCIIETCNGSVPLTLSLGAVHNHAYHRPVSLFPFHTSLLFVVQFSYRPSQRSLFLRSHLS